MPEFNLRAFAGGAGASGALHPCLRAEAEVRLGARLPLKNFTGPGSRAPCAELVQPLPDFLDARSSTAAESRSPSNRIPHQAVPLLVQAPLPGFASVCKIEPHANSLRHPGTAGNSRPLPFITVSGGTFRLPGRSTRASPFLPKSSCPRAATEPVSRSGPPPRPTPRCGGRPDAPARPGIRPFPASRQALASRRFPPTGEGSGTGRRPPSGPRDMPADACSACHGRALQPAAPGSPLLTPPYPLGSPTIRHISGIVFHANNVASRHRSVAYPRT